MKREHMHVVCSFLLLINKMQRQLFIEVPVPSQESEWSCIWVLRV